MTWKGFIRSALLLAIGAASGIEGRRFVTSLHQPVIERLASARSPDGTYDCIVQRIEPPGDWFGGPGDVSWRALTILPHHDRGDEVPEGFATTYTIPELLSGGLEISGKPNQIQWRGTTAIVLFDHEPWFEFDTSNEGGWKRVEPPASRPATLPMASRAK